MSCAATAARSLSAVARAAPASPPAPAAAGGCMHQEDVAAAQLSRRDRVVRRCQRFRRCIHARHQQRRTAARPRRSLLGLGSPSPGPRLRGYIRPDRLSLGRRSAAYAGTATTGQAACLRQ